MRPDEVKRELKTKFMSNNITENLKDAYSAINSLGAVAENTNITHVVAVRLREQYEAAGLALDSIKDQHAALVAVADAARVLQYQLGQVSFMQHKELYSAWLKMTNALIALKDMRNSN